MKDRLKFSVVAVMFTVMFAGLSTGAAFVRFCDLQLLADDNSQKESPELKAILDQMDRTSESFKSAQADFTWEQFQKVVSETDTKKGKIYFRRRSAKDTQMAADILEPETEREYILFADNKLSLFQPRIKQITEHDAGKNREQVESFLVLGFGGRGHDLSKTFEVKFLGNEVVDKVSTAKLDLTPKSERGRGMFSHIVLWIDPANGISRRQQFFEPSGDYRLDHFTNIKVNEKISPEVFKLKTSGMKIVRPDGL